MSTNSKSTLFTKLFRMSRVTQSDERRRPGRDTLEGRADHLSGGLLVIGPRHPDLDSVECGPDSELVVSVEDLFFAGVWVTWGTT